MRIVYLTILIICLSGCTTLRYGTERLGDGMGVRKKKDVCIPDTSNFLDYINGRCE